MESCRYRMLHPQIASKPHWAAEKTDDFVLGLGGALLHAQNNRPTRHMPQGQNGLCFSPHIPGSESAMPKQPEADVLDPAASERQRQTGLRIKAIRKIGGLKQGPLATMCGADQSQWSRWERGERPAEVEVMRRFARRAKTSLDLIYEGRPIGTHPVLLQLLRAKVPELLLPDPTHTDQDTDTAQASYRNAIRQEEGE
jgi:transcriptional regulator with XRE-family HTH domain